MNLELRKLNNRGFSLMEIIVAVGIFGVIIVAATGVFQKVIESQRSAIAAQNTQESVRFALEVMGKEIRLAKKKTAVDECENLFGSYGAENKVYDVVTSGDGDELYFKNKVGYCVKYFLEDDGDVSRLKILRDNGTNFYEGYITPDEVQINNLEFIFYDDQYDQFHSIQPRVTLKMDVEAVSGKEAHKQPFKIQTTVSGRHYE